MWVSHTLWSFDGRIDVPTSPSSFHFIISFSILKYIFLFKSKCDSRTQGLLKLCLNSAIRVVFWLDIFVDNGSEGEDKKGKAEDEV